MLEYLHLKNVGPAPEMELQLAPRLNLLTGDNGLGKSEVGLWKTHKMDCLLGCHAYYQCLRHDTKVPLP